MGLQDLCGLEFLKAFTRVESLGKGLQLSLGGGKDLSRYKSAREQLGYPTHRRIQDFVRGGQGPLGPRGGGGGKAFLAPLDPRLTIWGSNFLWGGPKAPLAPPLDPRLPL